MNLGNVRRVYRKELRETLRDRRTMMVMLALPVFLYPALLIIATHLITIGRRSLEEDPAAVVIRGASVEMLAAFEADSALDVTPMDVLPLTALGEGEIDAVVDFGNGDVGPEGATRDVRIYYDASKDESGRARNLLEDRLDEVNDSLLATRLRDEGLPESFATPLAVADTSVASAEQLGGSALGRLLPPILILMTLLGAFFPAIDLTAGEKERGTLETLLTTPVPSREIVAGKFLTVCTTALVTAMLNMTSMLLTFRSAALQLAGPDGPRFTIPVSTGALVILLMVPLAVFFAAIMLGLAVRTQSFKEAQNQLTPVQFASIVPMYLPMIPGITLSYPVALIPIGGIAVLFRDLMSGSVAIGPAVVTVAAMVVYAAIALRFAAKMFGREDVLFGTGSGANESASMKERFAAWRASRSDVPRPGEAVAMIAVIGLLYFYLARQFVGLGLEQGIFLSQWLLIGLPPVLFILIGPFRARSTLALRPAPARSFLAGLMIIAGGIPFAWLIGWVQGLFVEIPTEFLEAFQRLLTADTPGRFLWLLLLIAVTPAICEELVFRGVLLQGLSRKRSMWGAVIGSALVFGAFHLSYETVIRFLPTAWLGLLMGYVVWHSRSIFPSMLMHFVNNATALTLVATTGLQAYIIGPSGAPSAVTMGAAVLLLAAGLYLLPKRDEESEELALDDAEVNRGLSGRASAQVG